MKNHLKVFFSHFDIAFTSFLWSIGAALVIPDLGQLSGNMAGHCGRYGLLFSQ